MPCCETRVNASAQICALVDDLLEAHGAMIPEMG
jgi:hypothetical protein